jgi:hypothetical protein
MQERTIGNWWFEWVSAWSPIGNYATREQAINAALEFHSHGTTGQNTTLAIGQWVVGRPVQGEPETINAKQWHQLRTDRDNGGKGMT